MGCGDIGFKLVKEGVKYGLDIAIKKGGEALGLPKPVTTGIAALVGFLIG